MRLHHFTSTTHLPVIILYDTLQTTESNLSPLKSHAGPDVVWFVDTPELGELSHGLAGSAVDKREVRLTVDVPGHWPRHYLTWAAAQGIDRMWLAAMISAVGGHEAADHWYVTFRPVRKEHWVKVENVYTGEVYWERG